MGRLHSGPVASKIGLNQMKAESNKLKDGAHFVSREIVKRFLLVMLVLCTAAMPSHAGKRKDVDTDQKEITLNKHQVAAVSVVLAEMRRRGERFRGWQMTITDEGKSYQIAFLEDPLDMAMAGGDGMSWKVRKRDLRLSGPWFYR
jgi:hypothetical protein